jgi:hypothetical protein
MYDLIKVTDQTYTIRIRNTDIGTVRYEAEKWTAICKDIVIVRNSRKKAVESVLYEFILRGINNGI